MPDSKPEDARGETVPVQGETQQRAPRVPHERDESAQSQAPRDDRGEALGELGRRDAERGVQDTTKQREVEDTYDRLAGGGEERKEKR